MGRAATIRIVDTVGAIAFVAASVCGLGTREWLQWASGRNGCRDSGSIIDAISTISPARWIGGVVDWNALAEVISVAIWISFLRVAYLDRKARLRQAILLFALATQGFLWTGQGSCRSDREWLHPDMDDYPEPNAVIRSLLLYPYLLLSNGATMAIDSETALLSFCIYHGALTDKNGLSVEARFVAIVFTCWALFFRQADLPVFVAAAGIGVLFNHAPWVSVGWPSSCCRRQTLPQDSNESKALTSETGTFTVVDDDELSPADTARGGPEHGQDRADARMSAEEVLQELGDETGTEETTVFDTT